MPATIRAATVKALRSAAPFDIPPETLEACLIATPDLVDHPTRLANLESAIKSALSEGGDLRPEVLHACLPVLGNIAEAIVESLLADHGWQPVYDDDAGSPSVTGSTCSCSNPHSRRWSRSRSTPRFRGLVGHGWREANTSN